MNAKLARIEKGDSGFVEDKDLSLLRTLTDDELVKACGGRTAHKGGRHGHRMNAKLARIEKAEAEYMLKHKSKKEAAAVLAEDKVYSRLAEEGDHRSAGKDTESTEDLSEVKKKKKKRKKEKDSDDESIEPDNKVLKGDDTSKAAASMTSELNLEPVIKKKKSKKRTREDNIENEEPQEEAGVIKKKSKKRTREDNIENE